MIALLILILLLILTCVAAVRSAMDISKNKLNKVVFFVCILLIVAEAILILQEMIKGN